MTPRYFSIPGIIAKDLGTGVDAVDICDILPPSSVIRREDLPGLGFVSWVEPGEQPLIAN